MPEFLLRYKLPEDLSTFTEEEDFVANMLDLADKITALTRTIFFNWDVCYEVREFGHTSGMPDLYVTAWVTDKDDSFQPYVEQAEQEIEALLRQYASPSQTIGCWFQRVKGKWGEARGLREST